MTIINPSLVKTPPSIVVTQAIKELSDQRYGD
ncbi:MAG: hypothetical protein ACJASU_002243 [Cognaticolwellia sp.]|jgi:hypothetical protein